MQQNTGKIQRVPRRLLVQRCWFTKSAGLSHQSKWINYGYEPAMIPVQCDEGILSYAFETSPFRQPLLVDESHWYVYVYVYIYICPNGITYI